MLSLCNQEISTEFTGGDPLEQWKVYGSMHNPYIKRRTTKYNPAPPKAAAKPTVKPTSAASAAKKEISDSKAKGKEPDENKSGRSTPQPGAPAPLKRSDSKSNLKRDKSVGDIFKSFAKAKPKAKAADKAAEDGMLSVLYDAFADLCRTNARHVGR